MADCTSASVTLRSGLHLGLLDPDQRRIAQLVDARLDGQHRRQRHIDKLKEPGFQFALHPDAAAGLFDLHDDGGVRQAKNLGQNHAGLRISVIVRLQAGKNQVELLILVMAAAMARAVL